MDARERALLKLKRETGTEEIPYHFMSTDDKGRLVKPDSMSDAHWRSFCDWD